MSPLSSSLFLLVILILGVILTLEVRADISVHCLHSQIKGKWKFYMTTPFIEDQRDLSERSFLQCNKTEGESQFMKSRGHFIQEMNLELESPNKAYLLDADAKNRLKNEDGSLIEGTWTMIYDQGFEVIIDGKKFFSFNDYKLLPEKMVKSYCSRTRKGWYHDEDAESNYGCYYGEKMDAKEDDEPVTKIVNDYLKELMEKKFDNQEEMVRLINEKQKSWKAEIYPHYNNHTIRQMLLRAGYAKRKNVPKSEVFQLLSDGVPVSKYDFSQDANIELPENWDWRNVSGENYVSYVKDQKACGSCYIFATIAAIESRIRIKTQNKVKVRLAPQDIVSCSLYSQLCHGGFPYLASKYVQDFYLVPEDCFPYKAEAVPCSQKCKNPKFRVRVKDYYYIGGYYGAANERNMMAEIFKNGPVAISFMTYPDLSLYRGGIYHHIKGISGKEDALNPWEPVTHSVTIVGWGVDPESKEKYWIIQNSWGESWGENGFFRIRRGVDESSVESEVMAMHPEIEFLERQ